MSNIAFVKKVITKEHDKQILSLCFKYKNKNVLNKEKY